MGDPIKKTLPDEEALIRVCHRYLSSRQDQLDYKGAIEKGLPMGSGEIESSHRFVVQERQKYRGHGGERIMRPPCYI